MLGNRDSIEEAEGHQEKPYSQSSRRTAQLATIAVILTIVLSPLGFNTDKLPISLSWNEKTLTRDSYSELSMAVDAEGAVHVCYGSPLGLVYATNAGGKWSEIKFGQSAYFCSIAVDSEGFIHIAGIDDNRDLSYISNRLGAWNITQVDWNIWGYPLSIAVDSKNCAHISYCKSTLKYATNSNGSWTTCTPIDRDVLAFEGLSSDIAVDSNDKVHIACEEGVVVYITNANGNWSWEQVSGLDITYSPSIAVDNDGVPHVGYIGRITYPGVWGLQHATRIENEWSTLSVEALESSMYPSCSLAVDRDGRTHMSYIHRETGELKYARIGEDGFSTNTLSHQAYGGLTSCAIGTDADNHVHMVFVDRFHDLRYLTDEPPTMFLSVLLEGALVKAAFCVPVLAIYFIGMRIRRRRDSPSGFWAE